MHTSVTCDILVNVHSKPNLYNVLTILLLPQRLVYIDRIQLMSSDIFMWQRSTGRHVPLHILFTCTPYVSVLKYNPFLTGKKFHCTGTLTQLHIAKGMQCMQIHVTTASQSCTCITCLLHAIDTVLYIHVVLCTFWHLHALHAYDALWSQSVLPSILPSFCLPICQSVSHFPVSQSVSHFPVSHFPVSHFPVSRVSQSVSQSVSKESYMYMY